MFKPYLRPEKIIKYVYYFQEVLNLSIFRLILNYKFNRYIINLRNKS